MNEYLQEQHARTQEAIELVKAIASELTKLENVNGNAGTAWKFKPLNEDYPTQYIVKVGQPECEIAFHFWGNSSGSAKGKVDIHGNFHIGRDGNKFVDVREYGLQGYSGLPNIRVTAARGALAIAKEVQRRFLPEYLPLLDKAIAKRDANQAWQDATMKNLLELSAIVGARTKNLSPDATSTHYSLSGEGYGTITASDNSAQLELRSLSLDKARRILAIVAEPDEFSDAG